MLVVALALGATACGGGGTGDPSTPTAGPSTGVAASAAATTVDALCRMEALDDVTDAKATFYDDAHTTLHAIAAAADAKEVGSDTNLLIAMQRVEVELEEPSLPPAYGDDIRALRVITLRTLRGIGLDAPAC
jgi:hypothetical protein